MSYRAFLHLVCEGNHGRAAAPEIELVVPRLWTLWDVANAAGWRLNQDNVVCPSCAERSPPPGLRPTTWRAMWLICTRTDRVK